MYDNIIVITKQNILDFQTDYYREFGKEIDALEAENKLYDERVAIIETLVADDIRKIMEGGEKDWLVSILEEGHEGYYDFPLDVLREEMETRCISL